MQALFCIQVHLNADLPPKGILGRICSGHFVVAIFANAGCTQSLIAVVAEEAFPGQELLKGKVVGLAGVVNRDKAILNSPYNLCLACGDPTFGAWRRKVAGYVFFGCHASIFTQIFLIEGEFGFN